MDAAVLISGLSIYMVATLIYLKGAYRTAPLWCWSSVVMPPIALVFYFLYWRRSWQLFVMHAVGVMLLVIGVILFTRANPDFFDNTALADFRNSIAPASQAHLIDSSLDQFADPREVKPFIGRIDGVIGGKLGNDSVYIDEIQLDGGVLRFKKGGGLFPQNEIAIFVGISEKQVEGEWKLSVTPTSKQSPVIHRSFYNARTGQMDTDVFESGYWLDLKLSDRRQNQVSGFVKLLLPGENKNFIAGNFESYTSRIRYIDGHVDRFYDSKDTIEYVASLHLENKFKKSISDVNYIETTMLAHVASPIATTMSDLTLVDGTKHTILLELFKGEQGWTVDTSSTDDLKLAISQLVAEPPASGNKPVVQLEKNKEFLGKDFEVLLGKKLQVAAATGRVRVGLLKSVQNAQLVLHQKMGDGFYDVHIPKRQVTKILVLN